MLDLTKTSWISYTRFSYFNTCELYMSFATQMSHLKIIQLLHNVAINWLQRYSRTLIMPRALKKQTCYHSNTVTVPLSPLQATEDCVEPVSNSVTL